MHELKKNKSADIQVITPQGTKNQHNKISKQEPKIQIKTLNKKDVATSCFKQ